MSNTNDQELKIYEVNHRTTGEKSYQAARTADDACKQAGWLIGDCYVIEQTPRYKPVPDHEPLVLVKIPCLTCPFQYAECRKTNSDNCPIQPSAPDLNEWLKQVAQAHLCNHTGEDLTKKDHNLHQKWLPIADAIKELAPKP